MANFNEGDHPRDDQGRFTDGGGSGKSEAPWAGADSHREQLARAEHTAKKQQRLREDNKKLPPLSDRSNRLPDGRWNGRAVAQRGRMPAEMFDSARKNQYLDFYLPDTSKDSGQVVSVKGDLIVIRGSDERLYAYRRLQ